ncbi:MAG: 4Fe-4S dicluster domain-containing protein [bacterium]|nr:4Fe-4S dicluster domain-containing protein [bacterium]
MVKFTLNGKTVEAEESKTILQVATDAGIKIPTLCYHPAIEPYGGCRLCIVEITKRGRTKVVVSCIYLAEEGIEVKTDTEKIIRSRQTILKLLLARCPESKKLKEIAEQLGVASTHFRISDQSKEKRKNCILCGLCVRVCNEVMKVGAIGFVNRGFKKFIGTPYDSESDACIGCGACQIVCPTSSVDPQEVCEEEIKIIPSEYNMGLEARGANYVPFPQAVPKTPAIDKKYCLYYQSDGERCGACEKVCPRGAVKYGQEDKIVEEKIGTIIVATGYDQYDPIAYEEYGYGKYKDVITGLHYERIVNAAGPTGGHIVRPSDHKEPKKVVWIQCVGSRDEAKGISYCSRFCCMYTAKQAILLKDHCPESDAYVFYMDIRAPGKDYEEFVKKAQEFYGVKYIRGRVSRIYEKNGLLVVKGADTLAGIQLEIEADLVVLASAAVAQGDAIEFAQKLHIPYNADNFYTELHPKLGPCETVTGGVFLAGSCQFPKDIPDSVAMASGASSKAMTILAHDELEIEPVIAKVNEEICSGCLTCKDICAYSAIAGKEIKNRKTGELINVVAEVNSSLCHGCGACTATCRSGSIDLDGFTNEQLFDEIAIL